MDSAVASTRSQQEIAQQEAFFDAIEKGDVLTLRRLLNAYPELAKAKIQAVSSARDGMTGLHRAACGYQPEHTQCVQELVRVSDPNECTPAQESALMLAAAAGNVASVRTLMNHSEIDAVDHAGRTALMRATQNARVSCVAELLTRAQPDLQDHAGRTALMIVADTPARRNGVQLLEVERLDILSLLLPRSNTRLSTHQMGCTALHYACANGNAPMIEKLLPHSDVHQRQRGGVSALMLAASSGSVECVRLLCRSCDSDLVDDQGNNALIHALLDWHAPVVRELGPRCDLLVKNVDGETALDVALRTAEEEWGISSELTRLMDFIERLDDEGRSLFPDALDDPKRVCSIRVDKDMQEWSQPACECIDWIASQGPIEDVQQAFPEAMTSGFSVFMTLRLPQTAARFEHEKLRRLLETSSKTKALPRTESSSPQELDSASTSPSDQESSCPSLSPAVPNSSESCATHCMQQSPRATRKAKML